MQKTAAPVDWMVVEGWEVKQLAESIEQVGRSVPACRCAACGTMPNPVVGLASALARTFLVIGLGALAASTGYIGRDAAAGIGPLVAKVSSWLQMRPPPVARVSRFTTPMWLFDDP